MAAALPIWSPTYSRAFDNLPAPVRTAVQHKVDEMGLRLETYPHQRLQGRPEFRLRVGDHRVLYEFDTQLGRICLHTWDTGARSTNEVDLTKAEVARLLAQPAAGLQSSAEASAIVNRALCKARRR